MRALTLASTAAAAASLTLWIRPPQTAHACGGCFSPTETVTNVDSHRMAISLSVERTILYDQIRYSGDPQDFVWVLPVPTADAGIELADPVFFDDLENGTAPRILPPPLPPPPDCPPPPGNGGASGFADAGAASPDANGVDVFREETVGPYEIVVIGSEDPDALYAWLVGHDYAVPESTLPVMSYYVDIGSKFIVLRLAPDEGVEAMQPVRVEYSGYMATFPLKMVTVGASGSIALTLWVIAEQRYAAHNYGTVTIEPSSLVWDFSAGRSNYAELFRNAIDSAGGKAWVAEYAQPMSNLWFEAWEEAAVAREGIEYPYLTRLRTDILLDHIGADLLLAPSADAGNVDNFLDATNAINEPPPSTCPDWDGDGAPDTWPDFWNDEARGAGCVGCTAGAGGGWSSGALMLVVAGLLLRRRRRE